MAKACGISADGQDGIKQRVLISSFDVFSDCNSNSHENETENIQFRGRVQTFDKSSVWTLNF